MNWKKNRIDTGTTQEEADRDETNGFDNLANDHGTWHMIPYDLEFDNTTTLWEVLTKIRDLYPGYEMFFDKDGMFVFQLIPICQHDIPVLDHTQFKGLVISENGDYDLTSVRNATMVYGQSIETDRFADEAELIETTYNEMRVLSVKPVLPNFEFEGNIVVGIVFPETSETQKMSEVYLTLNDTTYPITNRKTSIIEYERFSEDKVYDIGDYCLYNGIVYEFIVQKNRGEWISNIV